MRLASICIFVLTAGVASADPMPDPRAAAAERAQAMAKLSFMSGVWAGQAHGVTASGKPYAVTQTERMGPMLGGDLIVIEGRGYEKDGALAFNAFGVVSYNVQAKAYEFRSYAFGYAGTFKFNATGNGYVWETPAGPGAVTRYAALVENGTWHEVGDYIAEGKGPKRVFEMNLKRIGDSDWPAANPISPAAAQ